MTTAAKRIQRKRVKGWRLPENARCVDRSSRWGNQFKIGADGTAEDCVRQYREMMTIFREDYPDDYARFLAPLRGKDLACFCSLSDPCHADILLELANEQGNHDHTR